MNESCSWENVLPWAHVAFVEAACLLLYQLTTKVGLRLIVKEKNGVEMQSCVDNSLISSNPLFPAKRVGSSAQKSMDSVSFVTGIVCISL